METGTTHFMLVRLEVVQTGGSGDGDEHLYLWIDPEDVSSPEALGAPDATWSGNMIWTYWYVSSVLITGGGAVSSGNRIDEIMVGKTLADIVSLGYAIDLPATVRTDPATSVTTASATLNGELEDEASGNVSVRVYWGDTNGGSIPGNWANTNIWAAPQTTGTTYAHPVSGLDSDTMYFYRFSASNEAGEAWTDATETLLTGEVGVEATVDTSNENDDGTDPLVFTFSRPAGATDGALRVNYSLGGTAVEGEDFNRTPDTDYIIIPDGSETAMLEVAPIDKDIIHTGNRSVIVTIEAGAYLIDSAKDEATGTIIDDDPQDVAPVVATWDVTNVTATSALLRGDIEDIGSEAPDVYVFWGTVNGGDSKTVWAATNKWAAPRAAEPHSHAATGLQSDSIYYYRFAGSNSGGFAWAPQTAVFSTGPVSVEVAKNADELTGSAGEFVISRPAATAGMDLTVYYTLGGTAVEDVNYEPLARSVLIPAGQQSVTIEVQPKADTVAENKTVTLSIAPGHYPAHSTLGDATLTIIDSGASIGITVSNSKQTANLTNVGPNDWRFWNSGGSSPLAPTDEKTGGTLISDLTISEGAVAGGQVSGVNHDLSWTDGTVNPAGSSSTSLSWTTVGRSITFTTRVNHHYPSTVRIYAALWQNAVRLSASLPGAAAIENTQSSGGTLSILWTIECQAASPGDQLTVTIENIGGGSAERTQFQAVAIDFGPVPGGTIFLLR